MFSSGGFNDFGMPSTTTGSYLNFGPTTADSFNSMTISHNNNGLPPPSIHQQPVDPTINHSNVAPDGYSCDLHGHLQACNDGMKHGMITGAVGGGVGGLAAGPEGVVPGAIVGGTAGGLSGCVGGMLDHHQSCHQLVLH